MAKTVEERQAEIQAALEKATDQVKQSAEKTSTEIKNLGKVTEDTKAAADKALAEQAEFRVRLQEVEQLMANAGNRSNSEPPRNRTAGEIVAESDEYAAFQGGRGGSARFTVRMRSLGSQVHSALTEGSDAAGGTLIQPLRVPGINMVPNQRLTIRDLLSWGRTTGKDIEFVRETGFTNNADVVSENPESGKPESTAAFELDSAKVATIAHWIHASKQVLDDAPMLASYIDTRLRYGLAIKEEAQLLNGSGVGLNIDGLYTQATAYANPGVSVTNETAVDRIRLAILQAELAEYPVDGVVLSLIDWAAMELQKDTLNRYMIGNPFGTITPVLWARPVVSTKAMATGKFLVGAFKQGAQGWDREDANVTVSTEDRDNFIKNMVTILAEERIALTVYRPEAFIKGDLNTAASGS